MADARISSAIVNDLIDLMFRGGPFNGWYILDSNFYLALLVRAPYEYNGYQYFDSEDEVTYSGYARRTIARSLSGFFGTQGTTAVSSGTSGTIRPAADQYFPLCTNSSQVVTHAALASNNQRYAEYNDIVCYWELPRPMQLSNTAPGFYPCLAAEFLTIRLDD